MAVPRGSILKGTPGHRRSRRDLVPPTMGVCELSCHLQMHELGSQARREPESSANSQCFLSTEPSPQLPGHFSLELALAGSHIVTKLHWSQWADKPTNYSNRKGESRFRWQHWAQHNPPLYVASFLQNSILSGTCGRALVQIFGFFGLG